MRLIMLDSGNTSLSVNGKHRPVEIAAIEIGARLLGEVFIAIQIISTER